MAKITITKTPKFKKGGFMGIQKSHEGWCTPLSNPHCTGHRRALALTLKKHHGFHENGGTQGCDSCGKYPNGGVVTEQVGSQGNVRLSYPRPLGMFWMGGKYGVNENVSIPRLTPQLAYGGYQKFEVGGPVTEATQANQWTPNSGVSEDGTMTPIQPYITQNNQPQGDFTSLNRVAVNPAINNESKPFDYSGLQKAGYQAGNALVQNAGNLYDMAKTGFGTKYDKVNYGQVNPSLVDPSEQIRQMQMGTRLGKSMVGEGSGGNASTYLSNAGNMITNRNQQIAGAQAAADQQNVGIKNQFGMYNKGLANQQQVDNLKSKARSEDIMRQAVRGTGQNLAMQNRDNNMDNQNQMMMKMMSQAYPDYSFDKTKGWYYHNTTGQPLAANK